MAGSVTVQVELEESELENQSKLQITCFPHLRATYATTGGTTPTVEAVVLFISQAPAPSEYTQAEGTGAAAGEGAATAETLPAAASESEQAEMIRRLTAQLGAEDRRLRELRTAVQELREENDQLRRGNEDWS